MVQAVVIGFDKLKVELGDGGTPETFEVPCGLTTKAFNRSKNLNETNIPDCDDESAPSWVGRDVVSLTWGVTGDGVLAEQSIDAWEDFFNTTESRNVRVTIDLPTSTDIIYTGKAHLSTFNTTGNRGEKVLVNIEMAGDGELVSASS